MGFSLPRLEYLRGSDLLCAPTRVLRGSDLDFFKDGCRCSVAHADSLAVQLRDCKGDQFGRGQVRLQHATGKTSVLFVPLKLALANPHWVSDPSLRVCSWQGLGVSRAVEAGCCRPRVPRSARHLSQSSKRRRYRHVGGHE